MSRLPVREIVLYKSGIGFFVRAGEHGDDSVTLTFRADEINDVLKSLAVFDQAGGQVISIGYDTPMDAAHRLSLSSIHLSDDHSLRDLLRDLRGRDVTLMVERVPGEVSPVRGRMIGVEVETQDHGERVVSVSLLGESGITICPWPALRGVTLHESVAHNDLTYVLETSAGDDPRRSVSVRLSPAAEGKPHDLIVYYVAPAPTWRVSYRIVATTSADAAGGKLIFQGWGLFDNRLDEDLEEVRITLIAGQPIAFIYDLYDSYIPHRPTIRDEARTAAAPVEFEGALLDAPDHQPSMRMMASMQPLSSPARLRKEAAPLSLSATPTAATALTKDAGEFFEYQVALPVSVRRGESALVPILHVELPYQRELMYNGTKLEKHPVVTMRFRNSSGLTLERGPVTVMEDGAYKGDAIVPFTRDSSEIFLAYAVELGITVTETHRRTIHSIQFSVVEGSLFKNEYVLHQTHYDLTNRTPQEQTVTIEAQKTAGYELFDTASPDEETAEHQRWRVSLPAQTRKQFVTSERELISRQIEVTTLRHQNLAEFLRKGWLDEALHNKLRGIVDLTAELEAAHARQEQISAQRQSLYKRQEHHRANLATLSPQGKEAELRDRILASLTEAQDELDALERDEHALQEQIADLTARRDTLIKVL